MTDIPTLSGPVVKPASGNPPKQLFVFLHGVGADGQDLITLSEVFAKFFPDAEFVSPNAPFPCDMAPFGHQWFSLQDRSVDALYAGVEMAEPIVNKFIDDELSALGLEDKDLVVIGFSQGTMTALHTLYRRDTPCAAFVGFSGAMVGDGVFGQFVKSKPPACLIHGTADAVVPFQAMAIAEAALKANGVECDTLGRSNLGHGIDPGGMMAAVEFIKRYVKP